MPATACTCCGHLTHTDHLAWVVDVGRPRLPATTSRERGMDVPAEDVTITITPDTTQFQSAMQNLGAWAAGGRPWLLQGTEAAAAAAFEASVSRFVAVLSGDQPAWPTWYIPWEDARRSAMHAAYDHRRRARRRRNRR